MRVRTHLAIMILGLLGAKSRAASSAIHVSRDSYAAGGRLIHVDLFTPPSNTVVKGTAVVLHGAGGILLDGPKMRRIARSLAENGYDVSLIHYFERTGTLFALDRNMQGNFTVWLDTVKKGIEHTRLTRSHGFPTYLYGYSLGGFLAVAAASDNNDVAAVAEHAGGIWNNQNERIGAMPPTLVVHGVLDQRVPLEKYARSLLSELRRKKSDVKTHFYPGQGHRFNALALNEVHGEVAEFFDAHPRRSVRIQESREQTAKVQP